MKSRLSLFTCGLLAVSISISWARVAHAQTTPSPLKWPMRSNAAAPAGKEIAIQAPKARAILNAYQNQNPVAGERVLRLVLWTPGDREPAPLYRERLSAIMLDIQAFYRREMERNGFGPISFKLPEDADGLLQIVVARGDQPRSHYSGETGTEIREDAKRVLAQNGIETDQETILIFCNLANWNPRTRDTQDGGAAASSSPYYATGNTRSGTAWQLDSPVLNVADLLNVKDADQVRGQYRQTTLARYNAIFIGGIAHELGHALSLPHNEERPDQLAWGKSLMGAGNRTYGEELRFDAKNETRGADPSGPGLGSFLPFGDALRLAAHPSFSGSVKGFDGTSDATLTEVNLGANGKKLIYSARVSATVPVYGVLGYFDPAGGNDYDAALETAIPDRGGRFSFSYDATENVKGKSGVLRVVPLHANGATKWGDEVTYPYTLAADGTVDVTQWKAQQQLVLLDAAVKSGKKEAVQAALRVLEEQNAPTNLLEIARVQRANFDNIAQVSPATADGDRLYLSEALPGSQSVGWLSPTYNRLPSEENRSILLSAGGQFFARGIYAHAPAKHVYDLDSRWKRLSGTVGAPHGTSPTVVSVLSGDGKELWRSPRIEEKKTALFDVSVEGVRSLELRVEDGGNGNGSDWGTWLDPLLSR